jgi:hypothetical protein
MTSEERKKKLEQDMARTKEEILAKKRGYDGPKTTVDNGDRGQATMRLNTDPIGIGYTHKRASRNKLPEGATIRKELTFNTYIEQIEDPRSFINILPESMKQTITTIPQPLVNQDEDTLLVTLRDKYNYTPTAATEALRNNFWMEFDRASATRTEVMNQSNIYLGVVSREHFHHLINSSPHVMAYIITRPPEYEAVMRGLLNLSTRRIRDVLNIPLQRADGSIQDAKIIELVLKAAAMVDLRAKGGYVQRSETKNLTLMKQENSYTNVFQAASSTKSMDLTKITGDIDAKIAALEKEMAAVPGISHQPTEPQAEVISADYVVMKDGDIV